MARKILLADDSVTAQNMGRRILTDAGYEVVTVNNGSAALKRIAESKPDLIVLDVYMPGYGGLEVCQRIREAHETARIPVLLTVGKLEPFKPEEVRRVRADAFIVKPFEASELLTALTKLEDKIVPQPAAYKPGRFAKAIAAIEESGVPEYGDPEKGWKNRLKIPPPGQRHHDDDEEGPAAKSDSKPSKETSLSPEAAPTPTAAILRGVTEEEIKAIEAAAAVFNGQTQAEAEPAAAAAEQPAEAQSAPANEAAVVPAPEATVESAEPPITFASVPSDEPEVEAAPAAPATVEPEVQPPVAEVAAETSEPVPVDYEMPAVEPVQERAPEPVAEVVASSEEPSHEQEVTAALASLAPSNGHDTEAARQFSGPRWIAESIALTDEESALVLDEEMQKAAAIAAAEAARSDSAFPAMEAAAARVEEAPPVAAVSSTPAEEATSVVFAGGVVAETTSVVGEPAPPEREEAAYAAAASAGVASVDAISQLEIPAPSALPAEVAPTPAVAEVDQQREAELAAAWASWKQIRDSVTSPEVTAQIADAAAAGLANSPQEEPAAQPEPVAEASTGTPQESAPEESGAIASIVDSVLAELKPKLMEEIAKKMKK